MYRIYPESSCRVRRKFSTSSFAIAGRDSKNPFLAPPKLLLPWVRPRNEFQEQLSAINALQLRFAELAGPERALGLLAEEALTVTSARGVAIAVALGNRVVCCARAGSLAPSLGTSLDIRSGLSGECFRNGEVVCCADAETDMRVNGDACRRLGVRSVLAVPLRRDQKVSGILAAFSPRPGAFGLLESSLLQLMAGFASELCIQNSTIGQLPETDAFLPPVAPMAAGQYLVPKNSVLCEAVPPATAGLPVCARGAASAPPLSAGKKQISKCLDRIRQDPALQLLGRAKAYLTIEALYDGRDRSKAIALFEELMFKRAGEIGGILNPAIS